MGIATRLEKQSQDEFERQASNGSTYAMGRMVKSGLFDGVNGIRSRDQLFALLAIDKKERRNERAVHTTEKMNAWDEL